MAFLVRSKPCSSDLNPDFSLADFDREHLCALFFSPAGTILQADVPAMPATNNFAILHNTFAEGESQVGADILDGVNPPFPLKKGDANTVCLDAHTQAVRHEVGEVRDPYPGVHVPDDILRALNFARPSMRTRSQDRT
jgi:hypothetical protein